MKSNKNHKKIKTIAIMLSSIVGVFALIWSIMKIVNSADQLSFRNTIMDFHDYEVSDKVIYPYGDYEFYYDQWLKTDNIKEPIQDGTIALPNTWAGKSITRDGEKKTLTSEGYASYRMTMKNVKEGMNFSIGKFDCGSSIRIFFNDDLIYEYGVLSKDKESNSTSGENCSKSNYVTKESTIVVTMEVGNSGHGGIKMIPNIYTSVSAARHGSISDAFIFLSIGILTASVLTSSIFLITEHQDRDSIFIFILNVILFLSVLFSTDGLILFNRFSNYPNFYAFRFTSRILTSLFLLIITLSEARLSNKLTWKSILLNILVFLTNVFSMFALFDTGYFFFYYWTLFIAFGFYFYYYFTGSQSRLSNLNCVVLLFTIGDLVFETPISQSALGYDNKGTFSVFTALRSTVFLIYFISLLIRYIRSVQNYNRLYKEKVRVRDETLKQQIQPHYLFNTLSVIRHFYHKDIQGGDEIMAMFADNFRDSIKNMKEKMIPFESEIETITRYIDLENKCYEKPFNMILDLDFVDFKVPPLSLEPIVENSVNYSHVNEQSNGYISISSNLEGDNVIIVINDNGLGYDTSKVSKTSIGQRNVIERLSLHLNAKVMIESSLGNGTKTTIVFRYNPEEQL